MSNTIGEGASILPLSDKTQPEKVESEYAKTLQRLDEVEERLVQLAQRVENLLDPILEPETDPEQDIFQDQKDGSLAPLHAFIQSKTANYGHTIAYIHSILSRVQL